MLFRDERICKTHTKKPREATNELRNQKTKPVFLGWNKTLMLQSYVFPRIYMFFDLNHEISVLSVPICDTIQHKMLLMMACTQPRYIHCSCVSATTSTFQTKYNIEKKCVCVRVCCFFFSLLWFSALFARGKRLFENNT